MMKKKLLTVVGAVGILACGACFLPDLPQRKPVPPPIRNWLDGIRSIRVEVANASPSHHLDSADLAQNVVDAINEQSWKTKVSAHVGKEAGSDDAVLAITVLSETVEPATQAKTESSTFLIRDSATLTRLNSALVWRETNVENSIIRNVAEENAAHAWNDLGFVDGVEKSLSHKLVLRMFSLR